MQMEESRKVNDYARTQYLWRHPVPNKDRHRHHTIIIEKTHPAAIGGPEMLMLSDWAYLSSTYDPWPKSGLSRDFSIWRIFCSMESAAGSRIFSERFTSIKDGIWQERETHHGEIDSWSLSCDPPRRWRPSGCRRPSLTHRPWSDTGTTCRSLAPHPPLQECPFNIQGNRCWPWYVDWKLCCCSCDETVRKVLTKAELVLLSFSCLPVKLSTQLNSVKIRNAPRKEVFLSMETIFGTKSKVIPS